MPETRYELATWAQAKVQRDGHITVEQRYYSAPFRCIGQIVDVRVTERSVQVYAEHALVTTHSRAASAGQRVTNLAHLPPHKMPGLQGRATVRERAAGIGPYTAQAIALLLEDAVIDRHSSAQRLVALADRHSQAVLERACQHAFECGDPSPQTIRNMLKVVTSGHAGNQAGNHAEITPQQNIAALPVFARSIDELAPVHALHAVQAEVPCWQAVAA